MPPLCLSLSRGERMERGLRSKGTQTQGVGQRKVETQKQAQMGGWGDPGRQARKERGETDLKNL